MAAKRSGIRTVILPKENQRDLSEIDPVVRESLRFVTAENIDTVLNEALYRPEPRPEPERSDGIITTFLPPDPAVPDTALRQ